MAAACQYPGVGGFPSAVGPPRQLNTSRPSPAHLGPVPITPHLTSPQVRTTLQLCSLHTRFPKFLVWKAGDLAVSPGNAAGISGGSTQRFPWQTPLPSPSPTPAPAPPHHHPCPTYREERLGLPLLLQLVYSPGPSSKKLPSANFCLMDSRSFFCACKGRSAGRCQVGSGVTGTAARPVHKGAQHPGSLPDAHMDLYLLRSRGTHSHRGCAGTSSASTSPRDTFPNYMALWATDLQVGF